MQTHRLSAGGRINRSRTLSFRFDGRDYEGHAGDTLASALLANGVHLVGRSFKYHRPRGILGAGVEEPNALVTLDRGEGREDPNQRATVVELYDGLEARSQNRWPSLAFDVGALNERLSPLLPAGFYYKTFMWPRAGWHRWYEPAIRARAGLGVAPRAADPDRYAQRYAHCEVLVIGAGAAGLAAAEAASRSGARVMLVDERPELGGSLHAAGLDEAIDGQGAHDWCARMLASLRARANVQLRPRTTAFGYYLQNLVALVERRSDHLAPPLAQGLARERLWLVRAARVILATGSIERPLVFADNDRPGVMLASAAQRYVREYAVLPGRKVVACIEDDRGLDSALALRAAGAQVTLVDLRARANDPPDAGAHAGEPGNRSRALDGLETLQGWVPCGTRGRLRVSALQVRPRDAEPAARSRARWLDCDLVTMSGGWSPSVHLHSQARGTLRWDPALAGFVPDEEREACVSVGACRGIWGLEACVADGREAGLRDASDRSATIPLGDAPGRCAPAYVERDDARKAFVDFQNDVTARDLRLAIREGFSSVEHLKRYTTLGMATDQGRTSNVNGLAIAADAMQRKIAELGVTTFRAPYTPVTFGALAGAHRGELSDPLRRTPIHEHAVALGAVFENVGQWQRARYFPRAGEDLDAAVARECRTVRSSVGIFDASTLGKIEVVGPDAAELMNRLYVNAWSKLDVGRCRYGIMLREDGFVFDDGVVGRLAPDRFHVTTTTSGAPRVLHHMEDYLQTEFTQLRAWLTSTTEQWGVIAVQGPRSRAMLEPLVEGIDLAREAFPHMAVREGRICGVPTRLFRVSFTGELGFEVNVPSAYAAAIWEALYAAAREHGGCAYGTEAMHVLRAEKGYLIVGQDTDGTVTLDDAGLDWARGKQKSDFVGLRSSLRACMRAPGRLQLVGLLSADARTRLEEGAQLLSTGDATPGHATSLGHVTSSYHSDAVGRPIALAMLRDGRSRHGESVRATRSEAAPIDALVVDPVFFDRENQRLAL